MRRDKLAETAAAAERHRWTETRRSAHDGVELPHEIGFGLRMDFLAEPVLPGRDDVIKVVVPRFVAVGHEIAKLGVVDVIQACIKSIIVTLGDPSPAEEAGREGTDVPGGHVRARLDRALNHVSLVDLEAAHGARLGVGVVSKEQRMARQVVVRSILRFDVRAGDPAPQADRPIPRRYPGCTTSP